MEQPIIIDLIEGSDGVFKPETPSTTEILSKMKDEFIPGSITRILLPTIASIVAAIASVDEIRQYLPDLPAELFVQGTGFSVMAGSIMLHIRNAYKKATL